MKEREYHGLTPHGNHHPLYSTWHNMRRRCNDRKNNHYSDYGGRCIKVCDRWNNSFLNFIKDIGRRPSKKHSLDRINNDGNYEPGNVRWATQKQQNFNIRRKKYSNIYWRKETGKYRVGFHKPKVYIGNFKKLKDAKAARDKYLNETL